MATTPAKPAPIKGRKKPARRNKAPAPKKPPHRPPHVPTEQSRGIVEALSALGTPHKEIAQYLTQRLGLSCGSDNTLRKHYPRELGLAKTHKIMMVSQGLYRKAVGAPAEFDAHGNKVRDEVKPEVTAQIFFLKAQAGWKDHTTVTIDPDQKPIPVSVASLNDKQLDELEARLLGKLGKKK